MAIRDRKSAYGRSMILTYWYERLTSILREIPGDKDMRLAEIELGFVVDCGRNSERWRRAVAPDLDGVPLG